jgi:hypothetical protein
MTVLQRNYTVTLGKHGGKTRIYQVASSHATEALKMAHQDWHMNCTEGVPNIATVVCGSDITSWRNDGTGWRPLPARVENSGQPKLTAVVKMRTVTHKR